MRGRGKPRGPRIISRYDPSAKVERMKIGQEPEKEYISVSVRGGLRRGGVDPDTWLLPAPSREQVASQETEPVKIRESHWLYHDYWVEMDDATTYRYDEVVLLIKRLVLKEERELARVRQEVETLERFGDLPVTMRDAISDSVRMFVWQRDAGRCARCGSREKLEFDHIIPVADGGSSTERNVQLLCEPCNRSKGRSVT